MSPSLTPFAVVRVMRCAKRADIVVFDADRPTVPYIIIEVKQGKLQGGKEQLRSYAHATGAPLAMWSNGILTEVWHRKNPNYFVPIHHLPYANQTIKDIVDQPWTTQTLVDKDVARARARRRARLALPRAFAFRLCLGSRSSRGARIALRSSIRTPSAATRVPYAALAASAPRSRRLHHGKRPGTQTRSG